MVPTSVMGSSIRYDALKHPSNVRALGMGNTFVAIAQGDGAITHNPAGLNRSGIMFSYENFDINKTVHKSHKNYNFYMSPFGYSQSSMKIDDTHYATVNSIAFSKQGTRGVDWGVTYKNYAGKDITSFKGWSVDFGLLMHISRQLEFGFVGKDIFKSEVAFPTTFATGVAYTAASKAYRLTTDVVQEVINDKRKLFIRNGLEWNMSDGLVLRGGYYSGNITYGASIFLKSFELVYGVVTPEASENTLYLFSFKFGKGITEYR